MEIDENWKFEEFNLKIQSCLVPHAEPYLKCLAFRFDYKGNLLYFQEMQVYVMNCQNYVKFRFMIHWCYRMSYETKFTKVTEKSPSAKDIAKMAENNGVKTFLTHMRAHMDKKENQIKMKEELKNNFSGISGIARRFNGFKIMKLNLFKVK